MCLNLYIGSTCPLPTTAPWSKERQQFHVVEPIEIPDPVRAQLGTPFVYYVGSHEGCGCGFGYDGIQEIRGIGLPDEEFTSSMRYREQSVQDLVSLRRFLQDATVKFSVRLLVTWDGDECIPPTQVRTVYADFFDGDEWRFEDHEMFEVLPKP